jgi:aspartyl-tRNA(Asn)/glutamyl-tRNA(Gln) amidotransferase subunit B
MPGARRRRLMTQYRLPAYDAGVLVADKDVADYFERAAGLSPNPKAVSNWIMTEMLRLLAERSLRIRDVRVTPRALADLIKLVDGGAVNAPTAKEIFGELFEGGGSPDEIVREKGLSQVTDSGALEGMVDEAIRANPKSVADYRQGKTAAAKFLIGQVMRLSRGKASPQLANEILTRKLESDDTA